MSLEPQQKVHKEILNSMENVFAKFVHVEKIDAHLNKCMLILLILTLLIKNHFRNGILKKHSHLFRKVDK